MNSIMTRSLALAALLFLMALACQPSNEPPPRPTPIPMAGLDLEYLEHTYLPTGVSGNSYVAMGSDGEVYIVGIKTGEAHQLTHDGRRKYGPVISERYVAWTEHHSPTRLPVRAPSSDIYMLDLDTGDKRLITDVPAQRSHLDIHGHRLVWRENRHQGTGYDIFSYDLESNEEIPISVRPGYQGEPAIHGDIVVWSDNRNSPLLGTVKAGCSNCPENHRDIYLYNFTTGGGEGGDQHRSPQHESLDTWQQARVAEVHDRTGLVLGIPARPRDRPGDGVRQHGGEIRWAVAHLRSVCDMVDHVVVRHEFS